jgi:hypothetical protein
MGKGVWRWLAALAVVSAASVAQAAEDPSIACFGAISSNPAFEPLRGKVVLQLGGHPDLSMLANGHRPNKPEKEAIAAWVAEGERCYDLGHDYRASAYPPVISALIDESMHALEALVAKLYAGKLTYAEFNEKRQQADDTYREKTAAARQAIQSERARDESREQAQQASIEAQRRTAAAQEAAAEAQQEADAQAAEDRRRALALQALANTRPVYTPLPPPRVPQTQNTHCYTYGGNTNCTTTGD